MSRELRLLAAALKSWEPPERLAEAFARAGEQTDWPYLLRLAVRHRVTPLLADRVEAAAIPVPPDAERFLRGAKVQGAFNELALATTTRAVLALLRDGGIEPVVLKGVPLSLRLHGRLGLRISRDVDVLVSEDRVRTALQLLGAGGFRLPSPTVLDARLRREKDVELVHLESGHLVELHWRLFDNPHLMPTATLPEPVRTPLPMDLSCALLPDDTTLLYLANHGAQHGWSRLKWLADFAALLSTYPPEKRDHLYLCASASDGRRALGQALLLCADFFDLPLSDELRDACRADRRTRWLRALALRTIIGSRDREIEDIAFGSTLKNVSHYLLRGDRTYLCAELNYDIHGLSPDDAPVLLRGARWVGKHLMK